MTMNRLRRCFAPLAAAAVALASVGCAEGPLSLTVLNLATVGVDIEATARVGADGAPSEGLPVQTMSLSSGEQRSLVFDGVPAETALEVTAGVAGTDSLPQTIILGPPGPHNIKINGNQNGLTVTQNQPFRNPDTLPDDPYNRGFNADRPPVNPSNP